MSKFRIFMGMQKEFFGDVVKQYFAPLKVLIKFFLIIMEMIQQFVLSFLMSSEDFEKLQEFKMIEEVVELSGCGASSEEIEKEL